MTATRVKNVMNRFHPHVWADIKSKYACGNLNPIGSDCKYEMRKITDIFNEVQLAEIEQAFYNKSDISICKYYYGRGPNGRDYSVETKLDPETGIFRAWFSAEYPGTGNGYYYILINPTTAIFVEKD